MGVRCSLLGHDYGDTFVERDREERGNEVVVTERELQECSRCGAEKVTSENTEVRSIEPKSREPSGSADSSSGSAAPSSATPNTDAGASGGSASSGAASDSSSGSASGGSTSGGAFGSATDAIEQAESGEDSSTAESSADPDADDAVILDDSPGEEPGSEQWDEAATDPDPEPEPELVEDDAEVVEAGPSDGATAGADSSGDAATSAEPERTDADPVTAADAATDPVDRDRGEWPDRDESDVGADDDVLEDDGYVEADTGFTSAGPVEQSGNEDAADLVLYCPGCGFERPAAGASLRAGDICPECRKGYLAEDR